MRCTFRIISSRLFQQPARQYCGCLGGQSEGNTEEKGHQVIELSQYAFLLIKPETMVITMIRTSKEKLQFCK
jgi:hypothetical protein